MFKIEVPKFASTNFGDDRSNTKEMAIFFEIQDGGSYHIEKFTSG